MSIELSKEATEKSIASLRKYLEEELEHRTSELQARLLLDFILEEIAPSVYNGAIADAQTYFRDRVADLEGACFAPEFSYTARMARKRPRS